MRKLSRSRFLKLAGASIGASLLDPLVTDQVAGASLPSGAAGAFFIHVLLQGGPDMRQLVVPVPSGDTSSYGYHFWKNRAGIYGAGGSYSEWLGYFNSAYTRVAGSNGNPEFGIYSGAGWLIQQYNAGKVAFVNNVRHSESRDHSRSLLVVQSGDYETPAYATGLTGIGARLASGAGGKILSLTSSVLPYCNGVAGTLISFQNSRNFGLYTPTDSQMLSSSGVVSSARRVTDYRALHSYYKARSADRTGVPTIYTRFLDQFDRWEQFTTGIKARMDANPYPDAIESLYRSTSSTSVKLNSTSFGRQMGTLYDALISSDITGMKVASLSLGGWDSHKWQQESLEAKFDDMFGTDNAFASVFSEVSGSFDRSAVMFIGDFGRQLKANGANSTDHGDGNTVVIVGGRVRGGTYGEMWPAREIAGGDGNRPLEKSHLGIEGRTSLPGLYNSIVSTMTGSDAATFFSVTPEYESGYGDISTIVS